MSITMKKGVLILFCVCLNFLLFGQDKISKINYLPLDSLKGTYQIQVINTRAQPLIPQNLNEIILKNRKLNRRTEIMLASDLRLILLSESELKDKKTVPLEPIIRTQN